MQHDEPARDRALDFRWGIPDGIVFASGMPDTSEKRYDHARRSIVAAACIAALEQPGAWVSYSRRKAFYAGQGRYQGTAYTYDRVLTAVGELVGLGLLEEVRAHPGDHLTTGRQSRIRASPSLLAAYRDAPFVYNPRPCALLLKDEAGDLVRYTDTRQTRRLAAELDRVNAHLGQVRISMPTGEGWEHVGRVVRARHDGRGTWTGVTPTPRPEVYRVFGRGRWDRHGRLYGWWQNLPKGRRRELLINGEVSVEPDFATLHPRILYAARGHRLTHDPYETGTHPRAEGKLALNVALNAKTMTAAASALMFRDGWGHTWGYTHGLLKAVVKRNAPIAKDIGADRGVRCMAVDSAIAVDVIKACEKASVCVLPVHDSFIVPSSQGAWMEAKMEEILSNVLGAITRSPASIIG
ncbi:hypothetical protein [Methylobacterium pseudosasicola]|uniref:DNA-directed RNA polymerase n=1 Tax=Methylobacterium pseudosasicola TaxID=582667 RepID=A0A1I4HWN1_9HYPH|nr:hypothetical protein [Methylobacterium pseudosasicola]SFL46127.1 hypothetical protein SAMN05192568_100582 [Methylobacterium pseudosasicola]